MQGIHGESSEMFVGNFKQGPKDVRNQIATYSKDTWFIWTRKNSLQEDELLSFRINEPEFGNKEES